MKLTFGEGSRHHSLQGLHQFEQPLPAAAGTASHPEQEAEADRSTPALFSTPQKQKCNQYHHQAVSQLSLSGFFEVKKLGTNVEKQKLSVAPRQNKMSVLVK